MKHYKITIVGKVQGVFFRHYTKKKADDLGLKGFVENRADGSVYIEVKGKEQNIQTFIEWCHRGSPASSVKNVKIINEMGLQDYNDFKIKR